jgi:hypothetical protein
MQYIWEEFPPCYYKKLHKGEKKKRLNQNSTPKPQFWPLQRVAACQLLSEMSLNQRSQTGSQLAPRNPQMGFVCPMVLAHNLLLRNEHPWPTFRRFHIKTWLSSLLLSRRSDNPDATFTYEKEKLEGTMAAS